MPLRMLLILVVKKSEKFSARVSEQGSDGSGMFSVSAVERW
jgi:hypothetical protein